MNMYVGSSGRLLGPFKLIVDPQHIYIYVCFLMFFSNDRMIRYDFCYKIRQKNHRTMCM